MAGKKKTRARNSVASSSECSDYNDDTIQNSSVESRKIFELFQKKLETFMVSVTKQLQEKDEKIEKLEQEIVNMKKDTVTLEDRVEDAEAYERRDTIVVSGSAVPAAIDGENPANIVCNLVKDKIGTVIKASDISVAHRLGKKSITQAPDKRNIIVKLCRREIKHDTLKACRTVQPNNLYVNESLTPTRNTAMFGLRQARRKFPDKVAGVGSQDGKVYVLLKPPNPQAPQARNTRIYVNTKRRFSDLCSDVFKCHHSTLVKDWPSY